MNSKTKYANGNLKVKDPDNIKYEYEDLKEDVINSKALKKFLRGKIGFKDVSKDIYITQATTYCFFFQEPIEQLINRYKKNQKELSDDETEEDLDVFYDMTDYANHALKNKQSKNTIRNKVRRTTSFLRKNGVTVPVIDVGLNRYEDSEGYFTKKDLPDKETVKTVISESKPKHKAIYAFMYTSGSGRAETCALTVKSVIDGLAEFSEETEPKAIVKDVDGNVAERGVIPLIRMSRKKTGKPYYTVTTPETAQLMIDYIKTDISLLDNLDAPFFKLSREGLSTHFQRVNLRHSWGKRGRYGFWSSHRLRHNHYTQINNHDLANALEGRVVHNPITKAYDHNLDDPEYLRERYKDHMHKFEIFDHYDVTIRDEEIKKLQEELEKERQKNQNLEEKLDSLEQNVEELGKQFNASSGNLPFHKINAVIVDYLSDIGENETYFIEQKVRTEEGIKTYKIGTNKFQLLQPMVLDYAKKHPDEFSDDPEYLYNLVKKLDIQIELSDKNLLELQIEVAKNISASADYDSELFVFINSLLNIIEAKQGVMKRVGTIDVDKFDYIAEKYIVENDIDYKNTSEEEVTQIASAVLMNYLDE